MILPRLLTQRTHSTGCRALVSDHTVVGNQGHCMQDTTCFVKAWLDHCPTSVEGTPVHTECIATKGNSLVDKLEGSCRDECLSSSEARSQACVTDTTVVMASPEAGRLVAS